VVGLQLKAYPDVVYEISEMGDLFRIEMVQATEKDLKNDLKSKPSDLQNDLINQLNLPDSQKRILLSILKNRFVTQQQLSEQIGITPKNIRNNMEKLKQRGLLERVGPLKGGHWKVLLPE
jgi:predicted HTH transcriptional regulator